MVTGVSISAWTSHISLPPHPAQSQPQGCVHAPYASSMLVRRHPHLEPCRTCSVMHESRRRASLPFTPSRMYALLLRRCCCSQRHTCVACVCAAVGVVVFKAVFCRQACHSCVCHATVHACLFVGVQHSRQPASHSIAKEQFRTICHDSSAWPQQSPCVWIMSTAGVASLRATVISSGSGQ